MKFNLWLTFQAFLKGLGVTLLTVLIAALTLGLGYQPSNPLEVVIWQYIGTALLGGIINALRNALTHLQG